MRRIRIVNTAVEPSIRYEEASTEFVNVFNEVRDRYFPELVNAKIKLLFDTKIRKKGGQIVLGRIQKSNDLIRKLTVTEARGNEGYDYVITLDKKAFDNVGHDDRVRIIRHELRHTHVDSEAKKPYKLVDHDITDFVQEVSLNNDDPGWARRVSTLTSDIYEQERDQNG